MGSIYAGIASVTEAAGVGVFGAIIVALVRFRFNWAPAAEQPWSRPCRPSAPSSG